MQFGGGTSGGASSAYVGEGHKLAGSGSFKRISASPIIDLTSLGTKLAFRNARGYWESGTFHVFGDVGANNGLTTQPQSEIGWASGPSLTSLTYNGKVITNAMMTTAGISATWDALATSCPVKDSNGTYHLYVSAVDAYYGTNPNVGGLTHWTASSISGPWSYSDTVRVNDATTLPTDCGEPVFWGGQWVLPFVQYALPPTGARQYRFLTSSSLNGPWTLSTAVPTNVDGYQMTKDAPQLIVEDGRLYLHATPNAFVNSLNEMTADLTTAKYLRGINMVRQSTFEGANNGWGAGSVFRGPGGDLYSVWQGGPPGSTDTGYWRIYGGKWVQGEIYVPRYPNTVWINNVVVPTAGSTITIPTNLPDEVYALDVYYEARETTTLTAGEYAQMDQGFDWNYGRAFPAVLNVPATFHGRIDLSGGSRTVRIKSAGTPTNIQMYAFLNGYWRFP